MGLKGVALAEPYVALRAGKRSGALLLEQFHHTGRTRTLAGTLLQRKVLGLRSMRPGTMLVRFYIQGRLSTGHPAACTYTSQQRLHTPNTSLMSQHPKPIARTARVAQLASTKLLVGAFQFSC